MDNDLTNKYNFLINYLKGNKKAAIAFSGGTDSTFLLFAAKQAVGQNVLAMTVKTPYIPDWEVEEAVNFCKENNINHRLIQLGIPKEIISNPSDRCYLCKRKVFSTLKLEAVREGYEFLYDGTNADDTLDYRPGLKALKELEVKSPLMESGLRKEEIRTLSAGFNLPTAGKPAYACLLTRLPYNYEVKDTELERIEKAELFLMSLGYKASRVRNHGNLARIELNRNDIAGFISSEASIKVSAYFREIGYEFTTIDIDGYRTGSFNTTIENQI